MIFSSHFQNSELPSTATSGMYFMSLEHEEVCFILVVNCDFLNEFMTNLYANFGESLFVWFFLLYVFNSLV